jgi:hypothetical protein
MSNYSHSSLNSNSNDNNNNESNEKKTLEPSNNSKNSSVLFETTTTETKSHSITTEKREIHTITGRFTYGAFLLSFSLIRLV